MMHLEDGFIQRLGLENLECQRENWNFRCPICGDSASDKRKRRGYLLGGPGRTTHIFYCHNCNTTLPFTLFLREISPEHYAEWQRLRAMESLKGRRRWSHGSQIQADVIWKPWNRHAERADKLSRSHPAAVYLAARKIPEENWGCASWCPDIPAMLADVMDKPFPRPWMRSGLVWELRDADGMLTGFQCRTIDPAAPKGMRFMKAAQAPGGFMRTSSKAPKIVLEGPIDAMTLGSAAAACSSNLSAIPFPSAVFMTDQEPRSPAICKQLMKLVKMGRKVCMLPEAYMGMDPNSIVNAGMSIGALWRLIRANTCSGLHAAVRLAGFRRD